MIKINLGKRGGTKGAGGFDLSSLLSNFRGSLAGTKKQSRGLGDDEKKTLLSNPLISAAAFGIGIWFLNDMIETTKKTEAAKVDAQIQKVQAEVNQISQELQKVQGYDQLKAQLDSDEKLLKQKIETLSNLMEGRQVPSKMLLQIAQSIPEDVWLTELKVTDKDVSFNGLSPALEQITDFIKSLDNSNFLSNTVMNSAAEEKSQNQDTKLQRFDIKAIRKQVF